LNIPVIGSATVQDVEEEVPMTYNAIDTGRVYLNITDYTGDAFSISDILRQDSYMVETLVSERAKEGTRALQEYFETRFLETANAGQSDTFDGNVINGFNHRLAADNTNALATIDQFRRMKLAFDKAKAPMSGRVCFVDPVVEATLNSLFNMTAPTNPGDNYNFDFEGLVQSGFERDHKFVREIFGWQIWTTNYLPKGSYTGASDLDGTTTTVADAVANIFMCVGSDQHKPVMRAWRMQPKTETRRNFELKRDEFDLRARFGLGVQRTDTLGVLITSASNY